MVNVNLMFISRPLPYDATFVYLYSLEADSQIITTTPFSPSSNFFYYASFSNTTTMHEKMASQTNNNKNLILTANYFLIHL